MSLGVQGQYRLKGVRRSPKDPSVMQRLWRIEKHDEDDDGTHLGALISWDWLDEPDWLQRRALKKVEAREKKLAKKIGSALSP